MTSQSSEKRNLQYFQPGRLTSMIFSIEAKFGFTIIGFLTFSCGSVRSRSAEVKSGIILAVSEISSRISGCVRLFVVLNYGSLKFRKMEKVQNLQYFGPTTCHLCASLA